MGGPSEALCPALYCPALNPNPQNRERERGGGLREGCKHLHSCCLVRQARQVVGVQGLGY